MNDRPTMSYPDGSKEWYQHGKRHRDNGPAILYSNGDEEWYQHGLRHRLDGPALVYKNGEIRWYINDKRYRDARRYQQDAKLTDEEMTLLILKYGEPKKQSE